MRNRAATSAPASPVESTFVLFAVVVDFTRASAKSMISLVGFPLNLTSAWSAWSRTTVLTARRGECGKFCTSLTKCVGCWVRGGEGAVGGWRASAVAAGVVVAEGEASLRMRVWRVAGGFEGRYARGGKRGLLFSKAAAISGSVIPACNSV